MTDFLPSLSVAIPTYNNESVLRRCLTSWQLSAAACRVEIIVIEDGCLPTEWDEADLACRIREGGWKVATCGYERLGGYEHLGSSTLGELSEDYKTQVLKNGLLFHDRWARYRPRSCEGQTHVAPADHCHGVAPDAEESGRSRGDEPTIVRVPSPC